jgi:hypothetical protein
MIGSAQRLCPCVLAFLALSGAVMAQAPGAGSRRAPLAVELPAPEGASSPQVLVVYSGGQGQGIDYDNLSDAMNEAEDGDIVIVLPGDYEANDGVIGEIEGKSLHVVAYEGVELEGGSRVDVSGLASDDVVVLRGLTIPGTVLSPAGFSSTGSSGMLWCEDVYGFLHTRRRAAFIRSSTVNVEPGGLHAERTSVAVIDSVLNPALFGDGPPAARLECDVDQPFFSGEPSTTDHHVFMGSWIRGKYWIPTIGPIEKSLAISGSGALSVHLRDCDVDWQMNVGRVEHHGQPMRKLHASPLVWEGDLLAVTLSGMRPGDTATLVFAHDAGLSWEPDLQGAWLLEGEAAARITIGPFAEGGTHVFRWEVPELGPSIEGRSLFVSAVVTDALGTPSIAGASAVALLDGGVSF